MRRNGFCEFHNNLYWGPTVKKHAVVKWKLKHGSGQFNVYCITRAMSDSDQLDIIHCAFLKQKYYLEHPAYIYGIAASYQEALDIVLRISTEASAHDLSGRLLEYLDRDKAI